MPLFSPPVVATRNAATAIAATSATRNAHDASEQDSLGQHLSNRRDRVVSQNRTEETLKRDVGNLSEKKARPWSTGQRPHSRPTRPPSLREREGERERERERKELSVLD